MTAHGLFESADRSPAGHAWREDAACRGEPPERFTEPASTDDLRQAVATCADCPVRQPCLQTALTLERDADLGIWGGTTETTRRRIRDGRLSVVEALERSERQAERHAASHPRRSNHQLHQTKLRLGGLPSTPGEPLSAIPPMLTVSRDKHGDFTDATGRVIIFRIHGDPPYMLMIDGRCRERTETLATARQAAWRALRPAELDRVPINSETAALEVREAGLASRFR